MFAGHDQNLVSGSSVRFGVTRKLPEPRQHVYEAKRCNGCDRYSIAIPLHNRMAAEDYQYVVKTIKELA